MSVIDAKVAPTMAQVTTADNFPACTRGEFLHLQPDLPKTRLLPLSSVITLLTHLLLPAAGCSKQTHSRTYSNTNTRSVFDTWPGSGRPRMAPALELLALTMTAGGSDPPSQQTVPGQSGQWLKRRTLRGEQREEVRVWVILLEFQLLNCYHQE